MRRLLIPALLALVMTGVVHAGTTWRVATVSPTAEGTLRSLIAAEHLRVCRKALTFDTQLVWAARYKAQDMGYRKLLSHRFADGTRIWDFYDAAGIPHRYGSGEILAWNTYPDSQSAAVAFRGWLNSPGHRVIVRNCDYDRFGVGAFQTTGGTEGGKWFAAEFTNVTR